MRGRGSLLYLPLLVVAVVSFVAFWAASASLTVYSPTQLLLPPTLMALAFWGSVVALVLAYPLRGALKTAIEGLKGRGYIVAIPPIYFLFHTVVYGVLLERLLVGVFGGVGAPPSNLGLAVSTAYIYRPADALNTLVTLTLQPSIIITMPPYYSLALGPFSLVMGVFITILVTASIYQLGLLRRGLRRIGESIGIPALGVVGGASCCLSIPVILEYFSPTLQAVALTPAGSLALSALYYALPLAVGVALKLAVDGLSRTCKVISVASRVGGQA